MATSSSEHDPLAILADEFLERCRKGEHLTPEDYACQHPQLASQILEVFPALMVMENVGGSVAGQEPQPTAVACPQHLGEYRILRQVGRGGMGVVYEAVQETLGRHVALKVLPAQLATQGTYLERFRREAKAAARLHHTHIVPVFGVGQSDGTHFYAMQFIHGQGLDRVLDDVRRLRAAEQKRQAAEDAGLARSLLTACYQPPEATQEDAQVATNPDRSSAVSGALSGGIARYHLEVARLGAQAADALAYAHSQGVLHRDVKPSNLLLDAEGAIWVTDFGLAKADDSEDLTNTGDIVGTLRYMAPERFDGKGDARADVYGLGLTLFEMLALRPAFEDRERAALIRRVTQEGPPRLRTFDASVPRDLQTVVEKACARDAEDRYQNAVELAEDLRRVCADRPIKARRQRITEQVRRWGRRNPVPAALGSLVALLLVALLVGGIIYNVSLKNALEDEARQRVRAEDAERVARLREAEALVGQAHGIRYSRRSGQRFEALAALRKAAEIGRKLDQPPEWFIRLRNEAIAALALPDLHITQEWDGYPTGTICADVSEDFERYARIGSAGVVSVRRVQDDVEIMRLQGMAEQTEVFCERGGLISLGSYQGRYQLWDVSGDNPVLRLEGRGPFHTRNMRPDGKLLAVVYEGGAVGVHDVPTGREIHRLAPLRLTRWVWACLHPTEPIIALYSYLYPGVEIRDLATGKLLVDLETSWPKGVNGASWSPDGRMLALGSGDTSQVDLFSFRATAQGSPPEMTRIRTLEGAVGGGLTVAFNPAGDRLAVRGWNNVVRLYDIQTGLLFSTHSIDKIGTRWNLHFNGSGKHLAAGRAGERNDRIGLWSVADGREYRGFANSRETALRGVPQAAVHPSGFLGAFSYKDGVALYCLATGEEVGFISVPADTNGGAPILCFDGTGALLTNSFSGLFRWPIRPDAAKPGQWALGPPERLPFFPGNSDVSASRDGRVVVQCMWGGYGMDQYSGAWILHPNSPRPRCVNRGVGTGSLHVSMDGRWTVLMVGNEVKVHETATGRCVRQATDWGRCRFTPDGHSLLTSGDGGRVYSVGDWQPGVRLGAGTVMDVSADGTLAVMVLTSGIYRLVELQTGRELARLEDPDQTVGQAQLTPDGSRLVVAAKDGLRVWDLRRIREELAKMGLDWDAPPFPAPANVNRPVTLRIVGAEALTHANRGQALSAKGKADEAIASYREAIALDPKFALAHYNLGQLLHQKQQWSDAAEAFRQALAFDPRNPNKHNWLGVVLQHGGKLDEAIACFRAAIALHSKFTSAHMNLGHALRATGRLDEALYSFRQAIDCDPKYALAHFALGSVLHDEGQLDEAIACLRKATELHPTYALAHNDLGHALYRLVRLDEAITSFKKAIQIDPKYVHAQANLGLALSDKGHLDEAISCYKKALELDPKYAPALFGLGNALSRKRQLDEAIACFEKAIGFDRNHPAARTGLARVQRVKAIQDKLPAFLKDDFKPSTNEERLALAELCGLEKLYRRSADQFAVTFAADPKLGDDLVAAHRYNAARYAALATSASDVDAKDRASLRKQALDWLRTDLALLRAQLSSGDPTARSETLRRFRHWQQDGDLSSLRDEAALAQLAVEERTALAKLWGDVVGLLKAAEAVETQTTQGIALAEKGKIDDAIASFRKAIEQEPNYALAHTRLGHALRARGRLAEAIASFRKVTELTPKVAQAHTNLGIAYFAKGAFDEAIASFRKVTELTPKDATTHNYLSAAKRGKGQVNQAIAELTEAIRLGCSNTYTHEFRGNYWLALKKHVEAADDFEVVLKTQPYNVRVLIPLAILRANGPEGVRDAKAAVSLAEQAVLVSPKDAVAHRALGIALYRAKKYDQASAALQESLELGKTNTSPIAALYFHAMCQADAGDLEAAKKSFAQAAAEPINQAWPADLRERLAEIKAEAEAALRLAVEK